jgi:hypothetical protein
VSTETGDAKIAADFVGDAKAMVTAAQADEEQLDLLEQPSPEEMAEARERLGPNAGRLAVLREAREARGRGRPKGARNKRTDDFARYLLSFGQHPAITMMQIQATAPEALIEASEQPKVHSFRKDGTPNMVIERLSYEAAQSLRIRCAEALLPYLESKKPVAVDARIVGVTVIEEIGGHGAGDIDDGDYVEVVRPGELEGGAA